MLHVWNHINLDKPNVGKYFTHRANGKHNNLRCDSLTALDGIHAVAAYP